jgi:hypothetical protein
LSAKEVLEAGYLDISLAPNIYLLLLDSRLIALLLLYILTILKASIKRSIRIERLKLLETIKI